MKTLASITILAFTQPTATESESGFCISSSLGKQHRSVSSIGPWSERAFFTSRAPTDPTVTDDERTSSFEVEVFRASKESV
ncbi:uncharacterized protein IAS62_006506 [Cryptococcus decagattii]|uniref:Secreted protein n=1 Tax=Cryptococcus decagattii TaxID=1859122 RepID=A0ABZ2B2S4_9TREE